MLVEIAVQSVEDARVAQQAGADRVELCSALGPTGGITPSIGVISGCVQLGIPVHVLIRARGGSFHYGPGELSVMADDVAAAVEIGAAGVVIGAATPEGHIDTAALRPLIAAAGSAHLTLHRVCDLGVEDPMSIIETCRTLGLDRVLTSGGAPRVGLGTERLQAMVQAGGEDVTVLAGGGLRAADITALHHIGVREVHASAKMCRQSGPVGPGGGTGTVESTDPAVVLELVDAVRKVCR